MRSVSQGWINNQLKHITSESHLRITFYDNEIDISNTSLSTAYCPTTKPESVIYIRGRTTDTPSLDLNQFVLDGRHSPSADNYSNSGWVGRTITSLDGSLSTDNTISLTFATAITSAKTLTIKFDDLNGTFAVNFSYSINGATTTITGNDDIEYEVDLSSYASISSFVLTINKWSQPYYRPRVAHIQIGDSEVFGKSEIYDYEANTSVSITDAELPTNEINFSLFNINNKFNRINNNKYLKKKLPILVEYGYTINGSVEWISGGTYFLKEWSIPQNGLTASFTASNILQFASQTYSKGTYGNKDILVETSSVLRTALVSSYDLQLPIYNEINPLPICSCAEALQYIAQATCRTLWCDRDGDVVISNANENTQSNNYSIDFFNLYSYPEFISTPVINSVSVETTQFFQIDDVETFEQLGSVYSLSDVGTIFTINSNAVIDNTIQASKELETGLTLNSVYAYAFDVSITGSTQTTSTQTETISDSTLTEQITYYEYEYTLPSNTSLVGVSVASSNSDNPAFVESYETDTGKVKIGVKGLRTAVASVIFYTINTTLTLTLNYVADTNYGSYKYLFTQLQESNYTYTFSIASYDNGDDITISNPLIYSSATALDVKNWYYLNENRQEVEAEFRIDPRLEILDIVNLVLKDGTRYSVQITETSISFNGAFKGSIKGKIIL